MRYYCDFFIRSNNNNICGDVFSPTAAREFDFVDFLSPERLQSVARLRRAGISMLPALRYRWVTSSEGYVEGPEILPHITSITADFLPTVDFRKIRAEGSEFGFSFYWEGAGTGGGPLVTPPLSEILAFYSIPLEFGFNYCSE